ncbi:tetrahydroberberine oxidase-like [Salvia miltiorrhiza]|uniref:tetrahydroberberine oxidase-like n=1 Tax=Salvia miltiorrhiza TaxID=226208 RepID=UPI0025AD5B21|nr:tetrahydroberberine oxidase-like [Salvia miltiorrhiza]
MKTSGLLLKISLICSLSCTVVVTQSDEKFVQCLESHHNSSSNPISEVVYTQKNSSYTSTLLFSIQNIRFVSPWMPKPAFIVTPFTESHIQAAVVCSKAHALQLRVRCGGHDYEGLSYSSNLPFVIIDLKNLTSIDIDAQNRVAWVGGGVLLGNLSYEIAKVSPNFAFPNGLCPTVGVGGHFSGGGYGTLLRKYGLAADNVVDARIVNARGQVLDRKSMGEDLFWAIRGGGGASFGIITAWKITLVQVPDAVTVFTVNRSLEQRAIDLVHRWQYVAPKFDRDLFVRIVVSRGGGSETTVQAAFNSVFLGKIDRAVELMKEGFPELGLRKEDCTEMSWIEAVLYFSDLPEGSVLEDLTRRNPNPRTFYKAKSDYVETPIPRRALQGLLEFFYEEEAEAAQLILAPYGGKMAEISASEIAFPHRGGNIYEIQHLVYWDEEGNYESGRYIDWVRRVYEYVTPFVSRNPRAAYLNYRDLDLGVNNIKGDTSYGEASVWGISYFKNNFKRLVRVKSMVDPDNFFRHQQSIPIIGTNI